MPTTAVADVVLPAAIWGEKEGTYTNSERRVSRPRAAVAPPGAAKADFDIILPTAPRWGSRDAVFPRWRSPGDAFSAHRQRTVHATSVSVCVYAGGRPTIN